MCIRDRMVADCGFSQRNITIAALSLSIGIGFTTASEAGIWDIFPPKMCIRDRVPDGP